eukprot:2152199-Rhodomonas_salina.1
MHPHHQRFFCVRIRLVQVQTAFPVPESQANACSMTQHTPLDVVLRVCTAVSNVRRLTQLSFALSSQAGVGSEWGCAVWAGHVGHVLEESGRLAVHGMEQRGFVECRRVETLAEAIQCREREESAEALRSTGQDRGGGSGGGGGGGEGGGRGRAT